MNVREYIGSNWDNTTRFFTEDNDTLIGLPYPYTVPVVKVHSRRCIIGMFILQMWV